MQIKNKTVFVGIPDVIVNYVLAKYAPAYPKLFKKDKTFNNNTYKLPSNDNTMFYIRLFYWLMTAKLDWDDFAPKMREVKEVADLVTRFD